MASGSAMLAIAFSLTTHSGTLSCYYRGHHRKERRRMQRVVGALCSLLSCQATKEGLETLAVGFALIGLLLLLAPAAYILIASLFSAA